MRRALLIKSAQDLLGGNREVTNAVYMWHRSRLWLPFVLATVIVALALGWLLSFGFANSIVIAAGLAAVASAASTRYFVLAKAGNTIALLTGSPIRRVARAVVRDDLTTSDITSSGNTLLATDWAIDDEVYTVPKSCEQDMQAIISGVV